MPINSFQYLHYKVHHKSKYIIVCSMWWKGKMPNTLLLNFHAASKVTLFNNVKWAQTYPSALWPSRWPNSELHSIPSSHLLLPTMIYFLCVLMEISCLKRWRSSLALSPTEDHLFLLSHRWQLFLNEVPFYFYPLLWYNFCFLHYFCVSFSVSDMLFHCTFAPHLWEATGEKMTGTYIFFPPPVTCRYNV